MKITIEINGRNSTVECGDYKKEFNTVSLMKLYGFGDLYHYINDEIAKKR